MKNYSVYTWILLVIATAFAGVAIYNYAKSPAFTAVCAVFAFVFAYAALQAPDEEKYRGNG